MPLQPTHGACTAARAFEPQFSAAEIAFPARPLGEHLAALGVLPAAAIVDFLTLQQRWGCRFGEALLAKGAVTPLKLAESLADALKLPFVDLMAAPPDEGLCHPANLDLYLRHLFLPWRRTASGIVVACADPSREARAIIAALYGQEARLAITAKFDILWTAERIFRDELVHDATYGLHEESPGLSARRVLTRQQAAFIAVATAIPAVALLVLPQLMAALIILLLALFYGANIWLRLLLFLAAGIGRIGVRVSRKRLALLEEATLPIYSILVPLYDEAHMVRRIVTALGALDYPAAKLDIKLVLEEDDIRTIAAAKALKLDSRFEILRVPRGHPRTKPRACNYALRFARGDYVVVYDAEDRPDPDQLKKVVAAFRAAPKSVACFQARLNVYNSGDNWLTSMFALEYAGWFDFLLPGLRRLGMPIPLGGTSNHFRADDLRAVGAWDAFNVTEDADLGIRLARRGYRVRPIDSSTYEEAIPTLSGWMRQRSRWLKGYIQTCLVHLRAPVHLARTIGLWPFLGLVIFMAGAVATSLLSLVFWAAALVLAWTGSDRVFGPYGAATVEISYLCLIAGHGLLTLLAMLAPLKRRWFHLIPYGATVFLYWLMISAAAYRALAQLIVAPFYWEKTRHGHDRALRRRLMFHLAGLGCALGAVAASAGFANPWPKDPGGGEIISNWTFVRQDVGLKPGSATNATFGVHAEYGIQERTTFVLDADIQQQPADGRTATNFGDTVAGMRFVLGRSDYSVLSAEIDAGVSGIRQSGLSPSDTALGGRSDVRLLFGEGFDFLPGHHAYATLEGGWRFRAGAPANEIFFDAGAGIAPWQDGLLMLQSFSTLAQGPASGIYRRYDQSKLQVSLAQRLGAGLWVQLGAIDTIAGAARGEIGGVVALWWQF